MRSKEFTEKSKLNLNHVLKQPYNLVESTKYIVGSTKHFLLRIQPNRFLSVGKIRENIQILFFCV